MIRGEATVYFVSEAREGEPYQEAARGLIAIRDGMVFFASDCEWLLGREEGEEAREWIDLGQPLPGQSSMPLSRVEVIEWHETVVNPSRWGEDGQRGRDPGDPLAMVRLCDAEAAVRAAVDARTQEAVEALDDVPGADHEHFAGIALARQHIARRFPRHVEP